MQLDLNSRLTGAFFMALLGLTWQAVVVTLGGEANEALIGAFSTIMLATIGIGVKTNDGKDNDSKNPE
jgi:hypothetical protein